MFKYKEIYDFFYNHLKKNKYTNFIKSNIELKKITNKNNYKLIVNSDSNNSISKKYFYKKVRKNYNSVAYTFIITHEKIINNIAKQIFTKIGPLAFLPLSNTKTSIVFSYNGRKKVSDEEIFKMVSKYNNEYKIINYGSIEKFNLIFSILRDFKEEKILPFGDLLHKIHPLAGQGFNMTLRDIKILSKIIDKKNDLGLEIDSSVIQEFKSETKHFNYIFGSSIDLIYQFFNIDNKINNVMSDSLFKFFKNKKIINNLATRFADTGLIF